MKPRKKCTPRQIAALGGKAGTGKAKARTPEQAANAARVRWAKWRAAKLLAGDVY